MFKRLLDLVHLEVLIAIMIALASATTAFVTWRASTVSSRAGLAIRQGLIDTVKKQASANESWRRTYEQARHAQTHAVTLAQLEAYESSDNPLGEVQEQNLRQYLLPNLLLLSEPLGTDPKYLREDGTYDLELRFADIQAESPDLARLDPQTSFKLADSYGAEQRWLTVDLVLLAISLFWLALAELNTGRGRTTMLVIGVGIYLFSLLSFSIMETVMIVTRGGVL
jgi:hypothetical protein